MKTSINLKFPCGYEIINKVEIWFPLFAKIQFDEKDLPICPIHGNKCKREIK